MAIVGDAYIVVRALTDKIDSDIKKGFQNVGTLGEDAGAKLGGGFRKGFGGKSDNFGDELKKAFSGISKEGAMAGARLKSLSRTGFVLQGALGTLVGGLSSVVAGIGAFGGSALGASASIAILGNAVFALGAGMIAAKLALGGVGKALGALKKQGGGVAKDTSAIEAAERNLALTIERNREQLVDANNAVRGAQLAMNEAIKRGREEIQQLGFEAESAALSESKAAIELTKAREILARVQDLPPNSRARQEAELAFQEAELNLRMAKDRSADLNAEQDRLAKTGVAGTNSVIDATNNLAEAEANKAKVVRDGMREQVAAEQALANAKKQASSGGGANPFEGLNEYQIEFVKFLAEVQQKFAGVKLAVSAAFLPPLTEAIGLIADNLFPVLEKGLGSVAGAMGQASISIAKAVTEGKNLENLTSLFETSGPIIESVGRLIGSLWGSILSILQVTAPIAQRFFTFLEKKLATFDAYLKGVEGNKALTNFFTLSADAAAQFGEIFGNIFGGIGDIIMANLGPGTGGQYILDWLKEATQGFSELGDTAEKKADLKEYFRGAAENTRSVMSAIGALIKEFMKLADMPEIRDTWDTLKEGAPAMGTIMEEAVKTGPAFADLVVQITRLIAAFADASHASAFLATISSVVEFLADLFSGPLSQAVQAVVGPILGVASALGFMYTTGRWVLLGLTWLVGKFRDSIKSTFTFITKHPVLAIFIAITTAFVLLYQKNEQFRTAVQAMFAALQNAFAPVLEIISKVGTAIGNVFSSTGDAAGSGIIGFLVGIVESITNIINQLAASGVFETIATVLGSVISTIMGLFQKLMDSGVFTMLQELFSTVFGAIVGIIQELINSGAFDAIVDLFMTVFGAIGDIVQQLVDSGVFAILADAIGQLATMLGGAFATILPVIANAFMQIMQAVIPLAMTLIQALLPAFTQILNAIMPLITMLIETFLPVISQLIEAFMPLITMIIEMLVPVILQLIEAFMPLITMLLDLLMPVLTVIIEIFTKIITVVLQVVGAIVQFLMPIIVAIIKGFMDFLAFLPKIPQVFADIWNGIVNFFKGIVNWMIGLVEGMVNGMIDAINGFTKPFREAIEGVVEFFGGNIEIGIIPKVRLPRLAKGGVVMPSQGGSLVNVAEAGRPERIEPLDANGLSKRDKALFDIMKKQQTSSGINITVNPSPGMDERGLAQMVSRELAFQMRKGSVY